MAKGYVSYKDKYNTKYEYKKNESHTLEEISKDTGVSMKGLQQIYNKGIGAYKTNPQSVRPNVKSKEQWAMARVYSSVMGGKASKIDANELKMEKGGTAYFGEPIEFYQRTHADGTIERFSVEDYEKNIYPSIEKKMKMMETGGNVGQEITCQNCGWHWNTKDSKDFDKYVCHKCDFDNSPFYSKGGMALNTQTGNNWYSKGGMQRKFAEGGKITQYEIEAMRNYINGTNPNPKLKDSFEKVLRKFGVEVERSDLSNFNKGKYTNPYDFSGYEYMRKINEEAGVSFLLTGEYQLVSKAIYEKDYAMWLFYSYLGRINISFKACQDWLKQAQEYFEYTMPIPIVLQHAPNAKDGRSYAMWYATNDKAKAESKIGRKITFQYNDRWYYQEIGMVGNFDDKKSEGWGSLYREKKTGLLIPEYTETSFHFNTLIHEFSHCLDFQTQLLKIIDKYDNKKAEKLSGVIQVNTETMSDAELALYATQLSEEAQKDNVMSLPITNHFDEFVDALIRALRACASGNIPLTQLYEQQALDVQQALGGVYGDLLLEQRERKAKERKEVEKADELREDKRFTWQGGSFIGDIKDYAIQNALQADLKSKLQSKRKENYTLSEIIEFDNLITGYFNTDYKKFMLRNPSKATERLADIKKMKQETNRLINNHYDNIKSGYEYGFSPNNELELYIAKNCRTSDFRDYKSWKECVKEKLQGFE
jgi:hypothetical protein